MKLLSYSFFEPKILPQHRVWDADQGNISRYYYNIPAVILTNLLLFPDYRTRFYLTPNVMDNPLSEIFNIFQNTVDIVSVNMEYEYTEPSILRMIPLWEDIDVMHVRDIDSVPTEVEFKFIREFERSDCYMGCIRTHEAHYGANTMLAGLSSFKPNQMPSELKLDSFTEYYSRSHGRYGCDQDLMMDTFTTKHHFTSRHYMDCRAYNQNRLPAFPCISFHIDEVKQYIKMSNTLLFDEGKKCGLNNWSGEPVDARGPYTSFLLNDFPDCHKAIKENNLLSEFYKV